MLLTVSNLHLYNGVDTLQHKTAVGLLDIQLEESKCYKGETGAKEIFIVMKLKLDPNQSGGASIVYWLKGINILRQSSIFKDSLTGNYRVLK